MRDDDGVVLGDKVTDGLAGLRFTVFDDRQRKLDYTAIWYEDLPAYVEVEVATVAGLYGNWMFDIGWFIGPESPNTTLPEDQRANARTSTTGNGAGGGGGGDGDNAGRGGRGRDGARGDERTPPRPRPGQGPNITVIRPPGSPS